MVKKYTMTCKVCGGEHMGTVCTKFNSIRVLPVAQKTKAIAPLLLAAPKAATPKPKKARKAKKKRPKAKKASKPAAETPVAAT